MVSVTRPWPRHPSRQHAASPSRAYLLYWRVREGGVKRLMLVIPMLLALGGAALAAIMLGVDRTVDETQLPGWLQFGEENSRTLLGAVVGGLLTVVVLVFWVRILTVQMTASAFSARQLQGFLRDRFQQVAMGLVIAALVYLLVVGQALPDGPEGLPTVPHLSVAVAGLLTVAVTVVILASVSEGTRSSQTGVLIRRIADQVIARIRRFHPELGTTETVGLMELQTPPPPEGPAHVIQASKSGWVQRINEDALLDALPRGAVAELQIRVGHYVTSGTPVCQVWAPSEDKPARPGAELAEAVNARVRRAITVGDGPTLEEDIGFGVRMLADVAERALAPATGDTSAAAEAIMRIGSILREVLCRDLPAPVRHDDADRELLRPREMSLNDYVETGFNRIRRSGAHSPDLAMTLLSTFGMLRHELARIHCLERAEPLHRQTHLLLQGARASGMIEDDFQELCQVAEREGLLTRQAV